MSVSLFSSRQLFSHLLNSTVLLVRGKKVKNIYIGITFHADSILSSTAEKVLHFILPVYAFSVLN